MTSPDGRATPVLLVVGDGEVTTALAAFARALAWEPLVVNDAEDARTAAARLGPADAAVVLSHHEGIDGPALAACLASEAGYVGGMGSRRTQERRREWLLSHEVSEEQADSVHGPAGLDIGADTPGEIAASIVAEIIAVRRGVSGGSLRDRAGPIHPDLPPGEAVCPPG